MNSLGEEKTIWLVAQPKPTRKPNIKICGELHFPVSPEGSGKAEGRRRKGQEQPVSRRLRPQAFWKHLPYLANLCLVYAFTMRDRLGVACFSKNWGSFCPIITSLHFWKLKVYYQTVLGLISLEFHTFHLSCLVNSLRGNWKCSMKCVVSEGYYRL